VKALKNAQPIKQDIGPKDEPILLSLKKIESEGAADSEDFTLTFTFDENQHFTNDVLKVHFVISVTTHSTNRLG
jgi:hypothetical protein